MLGETNNSKSYTNTKTVIGISSMALVQKQFGNYKRNELFRTEN